MHSAVLHFAALHLQCCILLCCILLCRILLRFILLCCILLEQNSLVSSLSNFVSSWVAFVGLMGELLEPTGVNLAQTCHQKVNKIR